MAGLGNTKKTIEILQKHQFNFQKRYGQNFLIDNNILEKIIQAAGIGPNDFVLEVGPGIGTLTQCLCEHANRVAAVEIDRALIPVLQDTLSQYDNIEIIHQDILKVDIKKLVAQKNDGRPIKVVANLPYYITTPIIMNLFECGVSLDNITIMVQREVAERMKAEPGTKDYGALTLAVNYYSTPEIITIVSPSCFMPRPKVSSAVIKLEKHLMPIVAVKDEALMFKIIRASFNQRRKTLLNGLSNAPDIILAREHILDCIRELGFSERIRGETLSLEDFAKLSNLIYEKSFQ